MMLSNEDYIRLSNWISTHPVLGTLAIAGASGFIILLAYINEKFPQWEFKKRYNKL